MLRLGYLLMSLSVVLLSGYAAYFVIRTIVTARVLNPFFKVVILAGIAGFIVTIVGLIIERRRDNDNHSNDGDD